MQSTPRFGTQRNSGIALAVASLIATCAAHAAPTPEELSVVKLYGNVSIAQDNLADWGPWAAFEATAAGGPEIRPLPGSQPELYRPLAQANAPVQEPMGLCASGSICGFGTINSEYDSRAGEGGNDMVAPVFVTHVDVNAGPQGEGVASFLPQTMSLHSKALVAPAGDVLETSLSQGTRIDRSAFADMNALTLFTGDRYGYQKSLNTGAEGDAVKTKGYAGIGLDQLNSNQETLAALAQAQMTAANMGMNLNNYIRNSEGSYDNTTSVRIQGQLVVGYTTSADQMTALRTSNAQASYVGIFGGGATSGNVSLTVNFGAGTWAGSWNNGQDVKVYSYQTSTGNTLLNGAIGFEATGKVVGSNFTSTAVTAKDGTIGAGSFVAGAFYGQNASAVGGAYNIVKTSSEMVTPKPLISAPIAPMPGPGQATAPTATTSVPKYINGQASGLFIGYQPELAAKLGIKTSSNSNNER